jgi:hypothetical protein
LEFLQTTDYAGYIRRAFMDEGLMGTVAKLPLERKFKLEHVKEVRVGLGLLCARLSPRRYIIRCSEVCAC